MNATSTCTLRFNDGVAVTGTIHAGSPCDFSPVRYSGAVQRLPETYPTASSDALRELFQRLARELGATYEEDLVGSWSWFADDEEEWADPTPGAPA